MAKLIRNFGPLLLTNTLTTNIYQGGKGGTAGFYDLIRQLRIVNITGSSHAASLWLSTTGDNTSGKELLKGFVINANDFEDIWLGPLRLDVGEFLVGGADSNTVLSIMGMGTIEAL